MRHFIVALLTLVFALSSGPAIAALTQSQVSQLYVSIFGRASEGEGNSYWQTDPQSTSMTATANVMLNTEPAKAYFGATLNNNQDFIEHIYLNTLGKTYAEDTAGVDYWVSELDGGKSKGEVIAALIVAAQHSDNAGAAQDRFNNKVAVSNYCADNISQFIDLATFVGFIVNVTDAASSVTSAKELIDSVVSITGKYGHITFSYSNRVYRIAAEAGASPEDISAKLDLLAPMLDANAADQCLNLSPDGQWMILTAERGNAECRGWSCLALTDRDVGSLEMVSVDGNVIHPEGCSVAVVSGGNKIIYQDSGENGHAWDLWLIERISQNNWTPPIRITASSPYSFYGRPSVSSDGKRVVFECGNESYEKHSICEMNTDGTAFHVVATADATFISHRNPDYDLDGSIFYEGETPTEQIWELSVGSTTPQLINGSFTNDNSPCVLPDGSVASLWLARPGGIGEHELKVMTSDGSAYFMSVQDIDISDIGLGCGL